MSNQENKIVPPLRFPEFENEGDWEITTIGELGSFYYGKSAPKWSLSEDAPTLCVRYGELYTKFGTVIDKIYSRTNIDPKTLRFSKGGEILVPRVGEDPFAFSNCSYLPFPNIAIGEMISVYETEENPVFYTYYFNTLSKQFARVVEGQNVKNLYYVNLEPIKVGKPKSKDEQQKIANCLSSLDNVINAETKKLALLKDHKKGLLQQLFPAESETQPKFRFPEFKNDEDWEEVIIDDYFEVCSSKRVLQKDWKDDGVPFYRTRELVSLSKNEPFGSEIYISEELFSTLSKKYGIPKKGDFLVSGVGTLGILYQVQQNDKFYFKDGNVIWFKTSEDIISDYFEHCFQTSFVQNQIFGQSSASTVGTFTISNARKTKFWKPVRKEEQQKIANCLSAIDKLIETQTKKIKRLQNHKKGLLQQLFPNINNL